MSEFDRTKWETRYSEGRGYGGPPHPFFDQVAAQYLPASGRALDVAGGTGRHARWLARHGLDVTLCDISAAGLARAQEAAAAEGLDLHLLEQDLDDGWPEGPWDVILVSFFLVRPYLNALVASLAPEGRLLLVHPTLRNLERHEKPSPEWLLEDGELSRGVPGLRTLHLQEGWTDRGRHEVGYVGQRIVQ